jgi:DNA-binding GntR family transcriptional regulator
MGNLTFQPQQKTTLSREIYSTLRQAILDGALKPGERIVEGTIAKQMNVSRAPLREALKQLEKDGLLTMEAHRETRVISPRLEDLRELILTRVVLETILYQFAAKNLNESDIADMEALVEKMESAAAGHDGRAVAKWDFEFHDRLCNSSGLPRLYRIWFDQHVLLRLWLNVVAETRDQDIVRTAASHRTILEAVKARDTEAIAARVFAHAYRAGPAMANERAKWAAEMAMFIPSQYQVPIPPSSFESVQKAKNAPIA